MSHELKASAALLNERSEVLRAKVDAVHEALKAAHIGIEAWHTFRTDTLWTYQIGYAKIAGKWGVAVRKIGQSPDVYQEWLVGDAPRILRTEAARHIDRLIRQLQSQIVDAIGRTDEAIIEVDATLICLTAGDTQ